MRTQINIEVSPARDEEAEAKYHGHMLENGIIGTLG